MKKTETYKESLKHKFARNQYEFDEMKEQLWLAKNKITLKKSNFPGNYNVSASKRETPNENNHGTEFVDESSSAENSADPVSEEENDSESPFWERIYVFRSSNDKRGPPKPAERTNVSRTQFFETLNHLEKLSKRVNDAVETYKMCYRKYGYNLDESMYYVDQFNEHLNDTYGIVRSLLLNLPDQITQSDLNVAMNGVDTELRRQAFDGLSQNYQLSGSSVCCGIELDSLMKELQGILEYASAECNSDAGKEARREVLRKARQFRKEEMIRTMNKNEENTTH